MKKIYTKSYDSQLKKLKKHRIELDNLSRILEIIDNADDFNSLCKIPSLSIYNFERLKYDLNEFYSFNLNKNSGTIRLIVKPNNLNELELYLVFISLDHYKDFNIKKVIYYDE